MSSCISLPGACQCLLWCSPQLQCRFAALLPAATAAGTPAPAAPAARHGRSVSRCKQALLECGGVCKEDGCPPPALLFKQVGSCNAYVCGCVFVWKWWERGLGVCLIMCGASLLQSIASPCRAADDLQGMAHLDVWMLQEHMELVCSEPTELTPTDVSAAMAAQKAAAAKASALACEGHDVAALEAACEQARQRLERAQAQSALAVAEPFVLPGSAASCWPDAVERPAGDVPAPPVQQGNGAAGLESAWQLACENLRFLPMLPPDSSFSAALAWLQLECWASGGQVAACNVQLMHKLRSIEHLLFSKAVQGFHQQLGSLKEFDALEKVSCGEAWMIMASLWGVGSHKGGSRQMQAAERVCTIDQQPPCTIPFH